MYARKHEMLLTLQKGVRFRAQCQHVRRTKEHLLSSSASWTRLPVSSCFSLSLSSPISSITSLMFLSKRRATQSKCRAYDPSVRCQGTPRQRSLREKKLLSSFRKWHQVLSYQLRSSVCSVIKPPLIRNAEITCVAQQ